LSAVITSPLCGPIGNGRGVRSRAWSAGAGIRCAPGSVRGRGSLRVGFGPGRSGGAGVCRRSSVSGGASSRCRCRRRQRAGRRRVVCTERSHCSGVGSGSTTLSRKAGAVGRGDADRPLDRVRQCRRASWPFWVDGVIEHRRLGPCRSGSLENHSFHGHHRVINHLAGDPSELGCWCVARSERAKHRGVDQPRPDRMLTARSPAITAEEAWIAGPAGIGRSGRALARRRDPSGRDVAPGRPAEPDTRSRKPRPCQVLHPPHATDDTVEPNGGECQVLQVRGARVRFTGTQPTRVPALAAPATVESMN
jgi:hypothetical protein